MHTLKRKLEIVLRTKSRRHHENNSGWVEIFCPFCNDATRKPHPDHGHLYYYAETNFFNCFRCAEVGSITKLLNEYNIYDKELFSTLNALHRSNVQYSKIHKLSTSSQYSVDDLRIKTINQYSQVSVVEFNTFYRYMVNRCLDIDLSKYLVTPSIKGGYLGCSFINASDDFVTVRFINHPSKRYANSDRKPMYYFQDIRTISDYSHIIICEGIFDIINLSNYYGPFKDSFYIAINGNQYIGAVKKLITTYLKIGQYTVSVVFDNGLFHEQSLIYSLRKTCRKYNPQIILEIYKPISSKDSSEFMNLQKLTMEE
jgi:hypothetical protein